MAFQRTIKNQISLSGVGLHSGKPAKVTLKPASAHQGILFLRTDLPSSKPIEAHFQNVVNTQLATTIGKEAVTISTVEHLMSALYGFGIDNLLVEVDGPEVPVLDGSSAPFCRAILDVGVEDQVAKKTFLRLKKRVEVRLSEKWAVAEPSNQFELHASIDWDHPAIGFQEFKYIDGKTDFSEIASARTFGFLKDVEALQKMGLALGGSFDNAVVLNEASVLNNEGLRYTDEFVRHKVLDALGDFKLSGVSVCASFKLHRSGHDLHRALLVEIFKNPENYEVVSEIVSEAASEASLDKEKTKKRSQVRALTRAAV